MIISMTGYGAAESTTEKFIIKSEIRTLNSKYFDFQVKLPKECQQWEHNIKALAEAILNRGKVNMVVELQPVGEFADVVQINQPLFKAYYTSFQNLAKTVQAEESDLFKLALYSPNVLSPSGSNENLVAWELLEPTVKKALFACDEFRRTEGKKLASALIQSKNKIANGLNVVAKLDPMRVESVKSRIVQSLTEISDKIQVDQNRFEQELIYYIERLDISEEKVRLLSHLEYFDTIIAQEEPSGKVLGFLSQEIGREINTIGSKANDAGIQRAVISMKEELEKIKEQILNVL